VAHPNEGLAREGFAAFARGDMEAVGQFLAEDTRWHFPGQNPLSGGLGVDPDTGATRLTDRARTSPAQKMLLETSPSPQEPDLSPPHYRELPAAHRCDVHAAEPDPSRGRPVQAGSAAQQSRLARA
jgi:hypothetical protein